MEYLIIQAARFGDLVQTKRLICSVARMGEVHLLIDKSLVPLAQRLYPTAHIHACTFHGVLNSIALATNTATLKELAAHDFAKIYNCNSAGINTSVCRLFSQERVVGYRPKIPFTGLERSPLLTLITRITGQRSAACCNIEDVWAHFVDTPIAPEDVNPIPRPGGRGIGVVVAGRESRRSLAPMLQADILRILASELACTHIYFFGTALEKKAAHQIRRALAPSLQSCVTDLCGKTTWADLFEALQGLDCLLTPDTGTMHLAAHLGVPIRAFFLSSASAFETGPYGAGHKIWQAMPPCAPCRESAPCTKGEICHASFANRDFLRAFACDEKQKAVLPPDYITCLKSSLDVLGTSYTVVAGQDPKAALRATLRAHLAERLNCAPLSFPRQNLSPDDARVVATLFADDTDWMLSPTRYR